MATPPVLPSSFVPGLLVGVGVRRPRSLPSITRDEMDESYPPPFVGVLHDGPEERTYTKNIIFVNPNAERRHSVARVLVQGGTSESLVTLEACPKI